MCGAEAIISAADALANEATSVAYNVATTVGTKTNLAMPAWLLARIEALRNALANFEKVRRK